MKITRISRYSWFKLEIEGIIIHIDPGYAGYYESQGFDEKNFDEKADIVLITHHHKDHIQPKAIEKILKNETKIYAPKLCNKLLAKSFQVVEPGYSDVFKGIKIQTTNAYNTKTGHSTRKPHHKGECVGYVIEFDNKRIYHAGDTDLIPEMSNLGKVDIAFLPIGGTFTMDAEEAFKATKIIRPNLIIPMHTLKIDPKPFTVMVANITNTSWVYLEPGEKCELPLK